MMNKKIICLMLSASITAGAFTTVMAAKDNNTFTVEVTDVSIFYNVETKAVEKTNLVKDTTDTLPTNSEKTYSLEIPAQFNEMDILSIADSGFFNDNGLINITLSEGLKKIGTKAFAGADNLLSINIPDSVTEIGKEAFSSCDGLKTIKFGSGVTTIPQFCFRSCKSMTAVSIPETIKNIENSAFEGCKALVYVDFKGNMENISNSAFKGSGIKSITLPEGLEIINSNVFESCSSLEKVEIPAGVKKIDNTAFKDCKNLKAVYIPDSCKTIANTAFTGCKNVVIYCSNNSFAQSYAKKQGIKYEIGKITAEATKNADSGITVVVNGEVLDCGAAAPVIINGRTLVPLRPIFEALDVKLDWNGTTKTITGSKGTSTIKLIIGNSTATLNGAPINLDVPAQIIDGNTMVPLRFIGDCLGCEINWSQQAKTASISE